MPSTSAVAPFRCATSRGQVLGYPAATFVRTVDEVAAIAAHVPFTSKRREAAGAFVVGFVNEALTPAARKALMALRTDADDFEIKGREVYWLCTARQSQSEFSNAPPRPQRATPRNLRTRSKKR